MTIGRYIIKSNLGRYVIIYEECVGRVGYNEILLSIGVANTTAVLQECDYWENQRTKSSPQINRATNVQYDKQDK